MFVQARDLEFRYDINDDPTKNVIDKMNVEVKRGEFLAIVGHNGCGKSTFAKQCNAMLLPCAGKMYIDGIDTSEESEKYEIRRKAGLVLQNPENQIVASVVEEDVAFGPENLGVPSNEIRRRVDEALKAVDAYKYREYAPHKLSGGQKQRVAIAGVIAMEPDCLVLDEPTSMLDPEGRQDIMDIITKLNKERGITIILITHYMEEAAIADRVVVMSNGKIVANGKPKDVLTDEKIMEKYSLNILQPTEIIKRLKSKGYSLPDGILNVEECAKAIYDFLENDSVIQNY